MYKKTFPINEQRERAVNDWGTTGKVFTPLRIIAELYQLEKEFTKKWTVSVVGPAISVFYIQFTVHLEDVPIFKDLRKLILRHS